MIPGSRLLEALSSQDSVHSFAPQVEKCLGNCPDKSYLSCVLALKLQTKELGGRDSRVVLTDHGQQQGPNLYRTDTLEETMREVSIGWSQTHLTKIGCIWKDPGQSFLS